MIEGLIGGVLFAAATVASANDFVDNTFLIDLKQGSHLSETAYNLGSTSYESAYGTTISMKKWYSTKMKDIHITFLTKVNQQFGIVWGFSTGEKAEKYTIEPSYKLGAVFIQPVTKTSNITIRGAYTFRGNLKEKTCTADYGDIGGVQEVNCRLAATEMQPSETLKYLVDERPRDYKQITVQYSWNF